MIATMVGLTGVAVFPDVAGAEKASLDVLKMREIPAGAYDVQLEFGGESETVKLVVNGGGAVFLETSTRELDGMSGEFKFIGNGVFLARLHTTRGHRVSQWWIFNPDGTASVREIPDRGERQIARRVTPQ